MGNIEIWLRANSGWSSSLCDDVKTLEGRTWEKHILLPLRYYFGYHLLATSKYQLRENIGRNKHSGDWLGRSKRFPGGKSLISPGNIVIIFRCFGKEKIFWLIPFHQNLSNSWHLEKVWWTSFRIEREMNIRPNIPFIV